MDWSPYFPAFVHQDAAKDVPEKQPKLLKKPVTVADIGCGFGGLLVALAPMLPDELILGLEIRMQVTEYVQDRISALRSQHAPAVGDRSIVFPSYTIQSDAFIPLQAPNSTKPTENKKEYIIHSKTKAGQPDDDFLTTEAQIKKLANLTKIPSFNLPPDSRIWVASLTSPQTHQIRQISNIESLFENNLSSPHPHSNTTTRYYNPTPTSLNHSNDSLTPHPPPPPYTNISVLRANTMKFLPNFFLRSQLETIFLCFPDPHFKARKHKARIVSSTLCAEYAYVLRPGGCVYTITDVEDLAKWMRERFREFGCAGGGGQGGKDGMFEEVEIPEEGREGEWIGGDEGGEKREVGRMVRCIREETEEGKKVTRNKGRKFVGVWRRREDPLWPDEVVES